MSTRSTGAHGYAACESDFYRHWQEHSSNSASSYDHYWPAYRYGYDLGTHPRYGAASWEQIEAEACTLWEARNPGTWEQFKEHIHCAWEIAQTYTLRLTAHQKETPMATMQSPPARTR